MATATYFIVEQIVFCYIDGDNFVTLVTESDVDDEDIYSSPFGLQYPSPTSVQQNMPRPFI